VDRTFIKRRFEFVAPLLDERLRRISTAEAMAIDYGGASVVSHETMLSQAAIALGLNELKEPEKPDTRRVRKECGGENELSVLAGNKSAARWEKGSF
jgi:hypothetical protein